MRIKVVPLGMTNRLTFISGFFLAVAFSAAALALVITLSSSGRAATCVAGSLIKGTSFSAVYYVGADCKRYVFPNDKAYFSWYSDFKDVLTYTDADLAALTIGGNVTYRPGVKMVKIESDPRVYAIGRGGVLRWVKTETAAAELFGADWNKKVDDVPDAFFINYTLGPDINAASDYSRTDEQAAASTITADKQLAAAPPSPTPTPAPPACANASCGYAAACADNMCRAIPGPSPITVRAFTVDTVDVCFVGDAYVSGASCSVGSLQFADNANLKAVRPVDKYLYPNAQQLCVRATLSGLDRNEITNQLIEFANGVALSTQNRVTVAVQESRLSGELTLSRIPGTCNWWMSPNDLRERIGTVMDTSTDAVFVMGARTFNFGTVSIPDSTTAAHSAGIGGAAYTYMVKEGIEGSGKTYADMYTTALTEQYLSALDAGIVDPEGSKIIGNYCRDGKKDVDETGLDCGGSCGICH